MGQYEGQDLAVHQTACEMLRGLKPRHCAIVTGQRLGRELLSLGLSSPYGSHHWRWFGLKTVFAMEDCMVMSHFPPITQPYH